MIESKGSQWLVAEAACTPPVTSWWTGQREEMAGNIQSRGGQRKGPGSQQFILSRLGPLSTQKSRFLWSLPLLFWVDRGWISECVIGVCRTCVCLQHCPTKPNIPTSPSAFLFLSLCIPAGHPGVSHGKYTALARLVETMVLIASRPSPPLSGDSLTTPPNEISHPPWDMEDFFPLNNHWNDFSQSFSLHLVWGFLPHTPGFSISHLYALLWISRLRVKTVSRKVALHSRGLFRGAGPSWVRTEKEFS